MDCNPYAEVTERKRIEPLPVRATPTMIARAMGPVVYAATSRDGLVKIGFTTNLARRLLPFGGWKSLLAALPGTYDEEQQIHASLAAHVARGREYYHRHPDVLAIVNEMRARMGADALVA